MHTTHTYDLDTTFYGINEDSIAALKNQFVNDDTLPPETKQIAQHVLQNLLNKKNPKYLEAIYYLPKLLQALPNSAYTAYKAKFTYLLGCVNDLCNNKKKALQYFSQAAALGDNNGYHAAAKIYYHQYSGTEYNHIALTFLLTYIKESGTMNCSDDVMFLDLCRHPAEQKLEEIFADLNYCYFPNIDRILENTAELSENLNIETLHSTFEKIVNAWHTVKAESEEAERRGLSYIGMRP